MMMTHRMKLKTHPLLTTHVRFVQFDLTRERLARPKRPEVSTSVLTPPLPCEPRGGSSPLIRIRSQVLRGAEPGSDRRAHDRLCQWHNPYGRTITRYPLIGLLP